MSRQFDEYMMDRFEIYGEKYSLIEPENIEELVKAIEIKSKIENRIGDFMHDEDSSGWNNLLQQQGDYISDFMKSLGEFNNEILVNNITYLLKKHDIRIGELEDLLKISTGYISRTIKEDSKKRISIDIIWKIAKLFNTDIRTLTEEQIWMSHSNTDLLIKFIKKLYLDTKRHYIDWQCDGGLIYELNERYLSTDLITIDEDDNVIYHPKHLNQNFTWTVNKDIMCVKNFDEKKDLVIIPSSVEGRENSQVYDFFLLWEEKKQVKYEKFFYTRDDPFNCIYFESDKLYNLIEAYENDVPITRDVKKIVSKYLEAEQK